MYRVPFQLSKAVGDEIVKSDLITSFVQILKDNEAEVRSAACSQLPDFAGLIDKEIVLVTFVPCCKDLITDTAQQVRAMLATHISGLAPILGKEQYVSPFESIMSAFQV